MSKPIFKVTIKTATVEEVRLIRAANGPQARAFVTEGTITVAKASQDDLVTALQSGLKVEELPAGEPEVA